MRLPGLRRRRRGDDGAAAVEFALIVPFVVLLLFGIISYGYMLSFRQAISQGAAEGVRAAAITISGTTTEQRELLAKNAVEAALATYGVSCSGAMTCTIDADATCGTATCVKVKLNYNYAAKPLTPAIPGIGLVMPDNLVYEAVAEVAP